MAEIGLRDELNVEQAKVLRLSSQPWDTSAAIMIGMKHPIMGWLACGSSCQGWISVLRASDGRCEPAIVRIGT